MTEVEFPAIFSQFKEGTRYINESKSPEWMDTKVKTIEIDIYNNNIPKMSRIGNYWSEEQTTEIVNLFK